MSDINVEKWEQDLVATRVDGPLLQEEHPGAVNALLVFEPDEGGLVGALWSATLQLGTGGFEGKPPFTSRSIPKWRQRIRDAYENGIEPQEFIDGWRERGGNGITFDFGEYAERITLEQLREKLR